MKTKRKPKSWTMSLVRRNLHETLFNKFLDNIERQDKGIRMGKKAKVLYKVSYTNIKDGSGTRIIDDIHTFTDDPTSLLYPPILGMDKRSQEIIKAMMTDEDCENDLVCVNGVCSRDPVIANNLITVAKEKEKKETYDSLDLVPAITAHGYKIPKPLSWLERMWLKFDPYYASQKSIKRHNEKVDDLINKISNEQSR